MSRASRRRYVTAALKRRRKQEYLPRINALNAAIYDWAVSLSKQATEIIKVFSSLVRDWLDEGRRDDE